MQSGLRYERLHGCTGNTGVGAGVRRWRKLKGIALIHLINGQVRRAEIHWHEAHGIGRKEMKPKRYVDEDYAGN